MKKGNKDSIPVRICKQFQGKRILVIGDLMVDQFIWGAVERISPEAPVPVVHVQSESFRMGGAANVAGNLKDLGAEVLLAGVLGTGPTGQIFQKLLVEHDISSACIVTDPDRPTIMKSRIIAHSQQVVRMDREETAAMSTATRRNLLKTVKTQAGQLDAIILSDYGKGVIDGAFMRGLHQIFKDRDIPITVDPQLQNTKHYKGATLITPNHHEAGSMVGRKLRTNDDILWAGETLLKNLDLRAALITRGEKGMSLFEENGLVTHIPTVARDVYDVTGAGDTVIAAFTLALATGAKMGHAAVISNYAAGIVVGEVGTATVSIDRLIEAIETSAIKKHARK